METSERALRFDGRHPSIEVFVLLAFLLFGAGIACSYTGKVHDSMPGTAWMIFAAGCAGYAVYLHRTSFRHVACLAVVCTIAFSFGHMRSEAEIRSYYGINPYYMNAKGIVRAEVSMLPETVRFRDDERYLKVTADVVGFTPDKADAGGTERRANGRIIVYVKESDMDARMHVAVSGGRASLPHLSEGHVILLEGKVVPIRYDYEDGRIDMQARAISEGLVGRMYDAKPLRVEDGEGVYASFSRAVGSFRYAVRDAIRTHAAPEHAAMTESLLFGGGYGDLDERTVKEFSFTGLIHILSVSGSHVSLLFGFVYVIAAGTGTNRRRSAVTAIVVVMLYCMAVGFNAPAVRAAFAGILAAFAFLSGRMYDARQAIHMAGLLLLAYRPLLALDVSFQLSFGATYGILLFAKPIYFRIVGVPNFVRGAVALTVAAQSPILPLQLYYFHMLSFTSLLAGWMVLPLLEAVILIDFALLAVGMPLAFLMAFLGDILVQPYAWAWRVSTVLTDVALFLSGALAAIPGGTIWVGGMPLGAWCAYGVALACVRKGRRVTAIACAVSCIVMYAAERNIPFDYAMSKFVNRVIGENGGDRSGILRDSVRHTEMSLLRISFIPAGNLRVVLVEGDGDVGTVLYIDASNRPAGIKAFSDVAGSLRYRGLTSVDVLFAEGIHRQDEILLAQLRKRFHVTDNAVHEARRAAARGMMSRLFVSGVFEAKKGVASELVLRTGDGKKRMHVAWLRGFGAGDTDPLDEDIRTVGTGSRTTVFVSKIFD